jgi:protein-disulfide isomerase
MKKMKPFLVFPMLVFVGLALFPHMVQADVEWETTRQLNLEAEPLDTAVAAREGWVFLLVPGEVLVYSMAEDRITKRIPVEKTFDSITYTQTTNTLVLTSSSARKVEMIRLEKVHQFDPSGSAFLGAPDSPVTIAVFFDYQ